jgi:hypothetical protein
LCRQIKSCLPVSNSNPESKPSTRPVDEADEATSRDEGEHKISWQLAKTDYGSVFVKADEKQRITYIAGYLRPGKEMPFEKIGQLEKAPVLTDGVVAWDVVRRIAHLFALSRVDRSERRTPSQCSS